MSAFKSASTVRLQCGLSAFDTRGIGELSFQASSASCVNSDCAYLVEANVLGLLTEALTAEVEVVLADETGSVLADAAT